MDPNGFKASYSYDSRNCVENPDIWSSQNKSNSNNDNSIDESELDELIKPWETTMTDASDNEYSITDHK